MGERMTRNWKGLPVNAVLFDLDGTLLDTAADMSLALDRAFQDAGATGPGAMHDWARRTHAD
jgi:phosphoglycolate phosphatase-like HAD superfamily hydrolase